MEFKKYSSILEPDTFILNETKQNIITENLYISTLQFLEINKISTILISLSGGVDSMVLLEIMCEIKKTRNIAISCLFINYNNREESKLEEEFLIDYCLQKNIDFKFINIEFKRNDIKRSLYEQQTRNIRYSYYKQICELNNCPGVFLGHHKDDLSENIFNNIMRGNREITDLCVLKKINTVLDVVVFRPMLDFTKDIIYSFAHRYHIPYFLDTTPNWSCRGKMRRNIFPKCVDCYGENYKNSLLKLGEEGEMIGTIFQRYIIDDLYKNNLLITENGFSIKRCTVLNELYVLKILIRKISHTLKIDNMRLKNIEILNNFMKNNSYINKKITFIKNYYTIINNDSIDFIKSL